MKDEEETFKKVFGESVEEALREMSEEGEGARARKAEAVPNKKEPEEPPFWITLCSGVDAHIVRMAGRRRTATKR